MSTQSPQIDQTDRELLVAYLDGELSSEDAAVVESRLASEATLRQELQELQHAWDALTELPRPAVAEDFTRTTLEMVAVAAQEDVESATIAMPVRRKRYATRILLVAIAAVLAGFLIARAAWPNRNDQIIENLPVIENIEAYRNVGSIEFLRLLHARLGDRLKQVTSFSDEDVAAARQDWQAVSQGDAALRRERIVSLDPAAAGKLQAKWKQFQDNTLPKEKEQLNELHHQLLEDDQSEALFATLYRFGDLLSRQSAGDKADLRSTETTNEKLNVVEGWVDRWEGWFRRFGRLDLNSNERDLVGQWLQVHDPFRRGRGRRNGSPQESEEDERERVEALQDSLADLLNNLSQETRDRLGDPRDDTWRIIIQLQRAIRPPRGRWDQRLEEEFVDNLKNEERLRLLLLPEEEMQQELRNEAFRREYGGFFGGGRGRGRGGERRGGPRGGRGGRRGGRPGGGPPDDGPRERRGFEGRGGPPGSPPPDDNSR